MPVADLGTGKIKLVMIHMVPVLTELKIYMERQMDNKALGSIENSDIKNICFLKTWGAGGHKKRKARACSGPAQKEGPHSTLTVNNYSMKVSENVKMISKQIIKL